ncbi:hypothetical protein Y046_3834 [Burkholderia pseudomallei MSHR2990]|nr:hypothetical protein Y046_3834 [Burkholderia pseudomallei MSHR2990]
MHAVFRLLERDAARRFEHFVGDFDTVLQVRIALGDLLADLRLAVVERRQAVHEARARIARRFDQLAVHLIRQERVDPLVPGLDGLAHRHPHVGVDEVDALDRFVRVLGQREPRAALGRERLALRDEVGRGPERLRRADPHVHPELRADQEQRIAHVVARVAEIGVADVVQRLVAVLAHRHHVGEHLRRMVFVGEPVEDGHARVVRELLDDLLAEATVLDRVVHPPEHARRVPHAFLVADLRRSRIDVRDVRALIVCGDFERAARAGRGLLEDERDVLAQQARLLGAAVLRALEIPREVEQIAQLARVVVDQAQQVAVVQVEAHLVSPLGCRGARRSRAATLGFALSSRRGRAAPGRSCSGRRLGRGRARSSRS